MSNILVPTPADFRFVPTVVSHGWCELPPFNYNDKTETLERTEKLSDGRVVKLSVTEGQNGLRVAMSSALGSEAIRSEVKTVVARCLNVEQDLAGFYKTIRGKSRYSWVRQFGVGRLLVAPTVWEDLSKTLLTTNTTWNVTVQMCRRLAVLGEENSEGDRAFPDPEQIAAMTLTQLTDQVRAGYRSAYLYELATKIAEGKVDVESWRTDDLDTDTLYKQIRALKGFGDYAVGSMLKLLGRYDRLGIDSSVREVFRVQLNGGVKPSDAEIAKYYESFGSWRGLALWMDVMKVNLTNHLKRRTVR